MNEPFEFCDECGQGQYRIKVMGGNKLCDRCYAKAKVGAPE